MKLSFESSAFNMITRNQNGFTEKNPKRILLFVCKIYQ